MMCLFIRVLCFEQGAQGFRFTSLVLASTLYAHSRSLSLTVSEDDVSCSFPLAAPMALHWGEGDTGAAFYWPTGCVWTGFQGGTNGWINGGMNRVGLVDWDCLFSDACSFCMALLG